MVVYLYDNSHGVPVLIIFANKLIKIARDLFENIKLSDKFHALANFFELFYVVAEAGPEIKRYMILNRFVGKLLDLYYDKKSDNKHYHRDLSDIPTYEIICNDAEEELAQSSDLLSRENLGLQPHSKEKIDYGLRIIRHSETKDYLNVEKEKKGEDGESKSDDDDWDKSQMVSRSNKEADDKRYAYLIRTISTLIRACKFKSSGQYINEDSSFISSEHLFDIHENEEYIVKEIISDDVINDWVVRDDFFITTKEAVNDMYCHLSWDNDECTANLLDILIADTCGPEATFAEVHKHFHLYNQMAKINDNLSKMRINKIIKNLYEKSFLENYKNHIKYADSLLNVVYQLVRKNYDACVYLRETEDAISDIERFNNSNPLPKASGSSQVLFRKLPHEKVDRHFTEKDKNMMREYNMARLQEFKDLLEEDDFESRIQQNLDNDPQLYNPDTIYERNEHVDYYKEEFKFWIKAKVLEDYGPILQVSYTTPEVVVKTDNKAKQYKDTVKINKDNVREADLATANMATMIQSLFDYLYQYAEQNSRRRGPSAGYGGYYGHQGDYGPNPYT